MINIYLILAGIIAGLVNSIAGGGAIFLYPILYSTGLPLLVTNTTIASSIWEGSLMSAIGYKKYLKTLPRRYLLILIPCLVGALIGATLLKNSSENHLKLILPIFILVAIILIALQPRIHKLLFKRKSKSRRFNVIYIAVMLVATLLVSTYGGYFGAGFGIIMLAVLGLTSIRNIHQLNALKNISSLVITFTSSIYFISYGLIAWRYVLPMAAGTSIGGYFGAKYASNLPDNLIRAGIVIIGICSSIYLIIK
jgi:uncharacterized membrane protein YfcA